MPCDVDAAELAQAIRVLAGGGLVAFPTETVWGIAADARQSSAVEQLRRFKGRDATQPIALLVAESGELEALGCVLAADTRALIDAFWPGPLTLVLPLQAASEARRVSLAAGLANLDGGLGVRCSPHPVASALARAAAAAGIGPLTATSCNRAGDPAARTRAEASAICAAKHAPLLLETGEDAHGGPPSTVIELAKTPPRILRQGAITNQAIKKALHPQTGPELSN